MQVYTSVYKVNISYNHVTMCESIFCLHTANALTMGRFGNKAEVKVPEMANYLFVQILQA